MKKSCLMKMFLVIFFFNLVTTVTTVTIVPTVTTVT